MPTGDHNPSRDHSPKLFIPTYDRSLWFFQYRPQVRTSIKILILVHNILNMNIQDCRDLVSKFVSSTFDGWPLPRRCGPPFDKSFVIMRILARHIRVLLSWDRFNSPLLPRSLIQPTTDLVGHHESRMEHLDKPRAPGTQP